MLRMRLKRSSARRVLHGTARDFPADSRANAVVADGTLLQQVGAVARDGHLGSAGDKEFVVDMS